MGVDVQTESQVCIVKMEKKATGVDRKLRQGGVGVVGSVGWGWVERSAGW